MMTGSKGFHDIVPKGLASGSKKLIVIKGFESDTTTFTVE